MAELGFTQKEISVKYGISQPYVSNVIREAQIEPIGHRLGGKRLVNTYDEKEVAVAILRSYQQIVKKAKGVLDGAQFRYDQFAGQMRENGLIGEGWSL